MAELSQEMLKPYRDRIAFSVLEMEGALCAWEHLTDNRDNPKYGDLFDKLGTAAMRHCAMQAGMIASHVYEEMKAASYGFDEPYDWEFVPAVCERLDWQALTEYNQFNGKLYMPDLEAILADMMAKMDGFHPTGAKAAWRNRAEDECDEQWGYRELLDDHPELTKKAMDAGEDPEDFVRWLGEKYDLTPVDNAWGPSP